EIKHFSCIDSLNYMHKMKIPQILTLILNLTLAQTIAQTGVKKEKGTQEWKPLKCLILIK
ncbi:hypothetical protein, partial [Bacteroides caccae]|uniref:hypothetical protein n=1 Tax=Bacteroides caccae TaxID=47678 RepID=UPI001C037ACA